MSNHPHSLHSERSHGSFSGYTTGFVLSVILTVAAFSIGLGGWLKGAAALYLIAALGALQIFVQLVFFMHMSSSSSQRWNVMAMIFTLLTATIVIGGTLWVMHNATMNMMP